MKNVEKMQALAKLSKYNIIFTLIVAVISIVLVFSTPLLNGVDQITTQVENVQNVLKTIPNDFLTSISDYIDIVGGTTEYLSLIVIILGIVIIFVLFLCVMIVNLIIKAIVKSENNNSESSLTKRLVILILILLNLRILLFMMFSSIVHTFIGLDALFVILIIFLMICLIGSFILLSIDTYHRVVNKEYVTKLFLLELFKLIVVIILVLFVVEFAKQLSIYLFFRGLILDINFFELLQLDYVIQYIFDILNNLFTETFPATQSPFEGFISSSVITFSEGNFNELIRVTGMSLLDDLFLQKVYNALIGFVLSTIVLVSSGKVSKNFDKNNIIFYLISSLILVFYIYISTPIILASSLATSLLVLLFVHIYQVIVHYEVFDTMKNKYQTKQESSQSPSKNDIIVKDTIISEEEKDTLQKDIKEESTEESKENDELKGE